MKRLDFADASEAAAVVLTSDDVHVRAIGLQLLMTELRRAQADALDAEARLDVYRRLMGTRADNEEADNG